MAEIANHVLEGDDDLVAFRQLRSQARYPAGIGVVRCCRSHQPFSRSAWWRQAAALASVETRASQGRSVHSPMSPDAGSRDDGGASEQRREAEMTATEQIRPVQPNDVVKTSGRHVGDAGRTGEIVAVLGEKAHPHYLVRWEDGRESILYPGEGTTIYPCESAVASAD
jgi:Domain of unknown function (DUF1918)